MAKKTKPKASKKKAAKTPAKPEVKSRDRQLDSHAWIAAALDHLAQGGVEAVRVEPLAKTLAVTKGSFYWHFADRRALLEALLAQWRDGRIAAIREQTSGTQSPTTILLGLADLYTRRANLHGLAIELAIRAAAKGDVSAAQAVHAVDKERLIHVKRLYEGLGWPSTEAQARAVLFYSYLFGQSLVDSSLVTGVVTDIAIEALLAAP